MKAREIMALEESLGHRFQRHELLEQALTHSSQARELEALGAASGSSGAGASSGDNENLEFLGDAVLGSSPARPCSTASPNSRKGNSRNCALIWSGSGICCAWPNNSRWSLHASRPRRRKKRRPQ